MHPQPSFSRPEFPPRQDRSAREVAEGEWGYEAALPFLQPLDASNEPMPASQADAGPEDTGVALV
jgi:hypothetical protein